MKRILCFAAVLLAILGATAASKVLPLDSGELIQKKYDGWSGVLRVWVFEGWQSGTGSLVGWLNRCIAGYEKNHNGVYVQVTPVDAEQLARFADTGLRAPDAILFCPGALESPDGLCALPDGLPVRKNIATDAWAAPVALGGYVWAVAEGSESALTVRPADEAFRCWSAAMLALSAGGAPGAESEIGIERPGVDLGLPANASIIEESFAATETPFTDFVNGEVARMPVTQREIARLQSLSDQGKGPDWSIDAFSEILFTDQLLLFAIPDCGDADAAPRRALAEELLAHLLSDGCQSDLTKSGAFPVTDAPTEYANADPMSSLDLLLRTDALTVPPSFSGEWRAWAADAMDRFVSGTDDASSLFRGMFGISIN